MTFDDYIKNPLGTSVMANAREMYRSMYVEKLDKLLVREGGKINYKLYKSDSKYYCHMKIPSETVKEFYYDVVIEFTKPKDKDLKIDRTLKKYDVRFYSNDPAFVFTFAHAFIKNGLFIDSLKDKMSKEAIKKTASVKNPNNEVGYVKTLYFAYLYMVRKNLFEKMFYLDKYNEKILKGDILDADTKIAQRTEATHVIRSRRKEARDQLEKIYSRKSPLSHGTQIKITNTSNKIKQPKVSKVVTTTKKTKTVKRSR